ncbi:RmuC domain protein [Deinococcus grandis]|uniref:RmuC domain protein n=1 Tax=Deinococcus grandis TaxID=57498 RepID=A0A100HPB4_9DEIO|nr:hypothetical protein DEGR_32430 [Deinococcus grandis]GAQ23180.1 RmuC domain protein [Deinococcus grandis]
MLSRAPQSSARATAPSATLPAWQGRALTSLIMGAALVGALLAPHASPAAWNAREGGIEACLDALTAVSSHIEGPTPRPSIPLPTAAGVIRTPIKRFMIVRSNRHS